MSFLSLLPVILQVVGFFLKWYGASEAMIRKYTELIEQAATDSLISIQSKDKLMSQRDAIAARLKAEQEKEGQNVP